MVFKYLHQTNVCLLIAVLWHGTLSGTGHHLHGTFLPLRVKVGRQCGSHTALHQGINFPMQIIGPNVSQDNIAYITINYNITTTDFIIPSVYPGATHFNGNQNICT